MEIVNPDHILVIQDQKMGTLLSEKFADMKIYCLNKSDGVVPYDDKTIRRMSEMRLNDLFFNEGYICARDQIPVSELKIFRVSSIAEHQPQLEESMTMESMSNDNNQNAPFIIKPVDYSETEIRKNVVGVLTADATKENISNIHEVFTSSSVYTLVFIQEKVREDGEEKITIIRPPNVAANYKDKIWILGNLKSSSN